jgi:hypothetical protein
VAQRLDRRRKIERELLRRRIVERGADRKIEIGAQAENEPHHRRDHERNQETGAGQFGFSGGWGQGLAQAERDEKAGEQRLALLRKWGKDRHAAVCGA